MGRKSGEVVAAYCQILLKFLLIEEPVVGSCHPVPPPFDGEYCGSENVPGRFVSFVGVSSALRDRGVGSTLVAWALARCFDAKAENALLLLSPANRTALRAYEKVGFRRFRVVDVLERKL